MLASSTLQTIHQTNSPLEDVGAVLQSNVATKATSTTLRFITTCEVRQKSQPMFLLLVHVAAALNASHSVHVSIIVLLPSSSL